jgi:hypothetical protein
VTETIQRMKFTQGDGLLIDERAQLAREAQAVLGYSKLAKALVIPDALMFGLRKLGIEPLVRSRVEDYRRKKARPGMWSGHKEALAWLGLSLTLGLGVAPMAHLFRSKYPQRDEILFSIFFTSIALAFTTVLRAIYCGWAAEARGHRKVREWRYCLVSAYEGNIPEFVLSKALQIKAEVPTASLKIESLYETEEKIERVTRDPFLVASLGNECYYIDVWDEKEYEAKL